MIVSGNYFSQMDSAIPINESMSAISMVVEVRGNHTLLVIERVEQGVRENFKAHLRGPGSKEIDSKDRGSPWYCWSKVGVVEIKLISQKLDLNRYRKWDTWSVEKARTDQLIHNIKVQQESGDKIPFNIMGGKSIFSNEAQFAVEGDPELERKRKESPKEFEKLFILYEEVEKAKNVLDAFVQTLDQPSQWSESSNVGHKLGKKYECIRTFGQMTRLGIDLLDDDWVRNVGMSKGTRISEVAAAIPVAVTNALVACIIDLPRIYYYARKEEEKRDLLERIGAHAKRVVAQNCFNWARNQLRVVGVQIKELSCERVAVIPDLYLKNKKKPG